MDIFADVSSYSYQKKLVLMLMSMFQKKLHMSLSKPLLSYNFQEELMDFLRSNQEKFSQAVFLFI